MEKDLKIIYITEKNSISKLVTFEVLFFSLTYLLYSMFIYLTAT